MISGLKDLQKSLRQFPQNVQKNICTGANRAAAADIAKTAKQNAPVRTGVLKRSIKVKKLRAFKNNPTIVTHRVIAGGKVKWKSKGESQKGDAFYARFVEFGTSRLAQSPFMRPAFEAATDAISVYKDYFSTRVEKEIKKASKNG